MSSTKWGNRGAWAAQSVKHPTSAQVMISPFVSSSPASGSVLTARNLEPALDSVCRSLSAPPPLCACSPSPSLSLSLSLSLSQKQVNSFKKLTKWGNNSAYLGTLLGGLSEIMYTKHFAHRKGSMKYRFYFLLIIGVFVVILG